MNRTLILLLLAALLLSANLNCEKPAPAPPEQLAPIDRINPSPVGTSQSIVHKTFTVTRSVNFPLDIPAHATRPQLHGTYRSFVQGVGAAMVSDQQADVDFLILNEEQYADFAQGRAGGVVFSVDASHSQDVNFDFPPSGDQPEKYYLVFRNSSERDGPSVVDADFTAAFE